MSSSLKRHFHVNSRFMHGSTHKVTEINRVKWMYSTQCKRIYWCFSVKWFMFIALENKTVQCILNCMSKLAMFTFQITLLMSEWTEKKRHFKSGIFNFDLGHCRIWSYIQYVSRGNMTEQSLICFNASDASGAKKAVILLIPLHEPLECCIFGIFLTNGSIKSELNI